MKVFISIVSAASILIGAAATAASSHKDTDRLSTRVGVLSCEVSGGIGLIVGSSKGVSCEFKHNSGSVEQYKGSLGKLGVDVGITGKSYLKWTVSAPAGKKLGAGALAGRYSGVSAGGSVGLGVQVHALVGGADKKISLQPFNAHGTTGLNVAAGATSLTLKRVQ
ncbi:DUF992 domain-containing protein [Phyllobacterium phragmitis]|uniref:DUF992 domain-containing protein n=1 Tax=Phyllobacterium phragmitis TaxID=2670329 RepID=A0A2S9IKT4_9HYPH|nr:DUF992 domain-containing protein [Phyllobacterium phragmitis]PRD41137.1 DUF992 domain-containing protein [Phyllobacterium phragmitis]